LTGLLYEEHPGTSRPLNKGSRLSKNKKDLVRQSYEKTKRGREKETFEPGSVSKEKANSGGGRGKRNLPGKKDTQLAGRPVPVNIRADGISHAGKEP